MSSKMKAVVMDGFGSADVLHLGTVERPAPDDTQVLIQVAATSVNRPDIVQREGNYPPPPGESDVLGLEIAGTVIELGKDVTDWHLGDRVVALVGGGGYAQFATAYAAHLIRIPESMSFQEAACICETYITAYLNLFRIAGSSKWPKRSFAWRRRWGQYCGCPYLPCPCSRGNSNRDDIFQESRASSGAWG